MRLMVGEIHSFRTETKQNFYTLDEKYGDISKKMLETQLILKKELKEFRKSNELLAKTLVKTLKK